jgi:hypothetical protein
MKDEFHKLLLFSILSITFVISSYGSAKACSCAIHPPFFKIVHSVDFIAIIEVDEYLKYYNSSTWEYISREEVDESDKWVFPVSIIASVNTSLFGEVERNKVLIWGDNGAMCRPYIESFRPGSKWVIALKKGEIDWGHPTETENDYYLDSCGEYYLEIIDGKVNGAIEYEYNRKIIDEDESIFELIGEEMELDVFLEKFYLVKKINSSIDIE